VRGLMLALGIMAATTATPPARDDDDDDGRWDPYMAPTPRGPLLPKPRASMGGPALAVKS